MRKTITSLLILTILSLCLGGCDKTSDLSENETVVTSETSAETEQTTETTKTETKTEPTQTSVNETQTEISETETETTVSEQANDLFQGVIEGNKYFNEQIGIGFTLPENWTFQTTDELADAYTSVEMIAADNVNNTGKVCIAIDEITVYQGQMTDKFLTYYMVLMTDLMNQGYDLSVSLQIKVEEYNGVLLLFMPSEEKIVDTGEVFYILRIDEDYVWIYHITGNLGVMTNQELLDLETALSASVEIL